MNSSIFNWPLTLGFKDGNYTILMLGLHGTGLQVHNKAVYQHPRLRPSMQPSGEVCRAGDVDSF